MFEGIVLACIALCVMFGGKEILTTMTTWPVIGGIANWYSDLVGQLPVGIASNVIYGVMAAQVVLIPMAILLYGPRAIRLIVNFVRTRRAA